MLERDGGIKPTRFSRVEEQVPTAFYILSHKTKNRMVKFWFRWSGETVSLHFHNVLEAIIMKRCWLFMEMIDRDDGDTPSNMKKNMKKRRLSIPPPAHSSPPSPVENIGQILSQNNVTFHDFLVNLDDVEVDDPSYGAQSESSKKTRSVGANKAKDTSSDGVLIAEQIQGMVSAMREGNQIFQDRYASQISGEDTFKLI
ncbi:hypothetical protein K1719_010247 [Acacia pycnantha]|nr:hypothetical protein K1719_010247 [Acacia pycnantha]